MQHQIEADGKDLPQLFSLWREYTRAREHAQSNQENPAAPSAEQRIIERGVMGPGVMAPINPHVVVVHVCWRNAVQVKHPVVEQERNETTQNQRTENALVTRDASNRATSIEIVRLTGQAPVHDADALPPRRTSRRTIPVPSNRDNALVENPASVSNAANICNLSNLVQQLGNQLANRSKFVCFLLIFFLQRGR